MSWRLPDRTTLETWFLPFPTEPGSRVLDACCGRRLPLLDEAARSRGLELVVCSLTPQAEDVDKADLRALPYPDAHFLGVLSNHTLEHISLADIPQCLAEIYRVIEPGGFFFLHLPIRTVKGTTKKKYRSSPVRNPERDRHHHCSHPGMDFRDKTEAVGFQLVAQLESHNPTRFRIGACWMFEKPVI